MSRGSQFKHVAVHNVTRSKMDLSHYRRGTYDMFFLYPILVEDALPGDHWKIGNEIVLRMMPMVAPIMHEINCYVHYFFVPKRIMWTQFERYYFRGPDGRFTASVPKVAFPPAGVMSTLKAPGGYFDHLYGFCSDTTVEIPAANRGDYLRIPDAWPLMAYNLVWHHFYRDENFQPGLDTAGVSDFDHPMDGDLNQYNVGSASVDTQGLHVRAFGKDYFTSSLSFQQKGDPLAIPISGQFIVGAIDTTITPPATGTVSWSRSSPSQNPVNVSVFPVGNQSGRFYAGVTPADGAAFNVTDLRWVTQMQRWKEVLARGGSRFTEGLRAIFGVSPRDERLDRPEYIGGSRTPVVISEVLQTSGTQNPTSTNSTGLTPQGTMAGHGISADRTFIASYRVTEPGVIIGIMSIMPITIYQQGFERMWMRDSVYEEYWPQFQQLSEQPVKHEEIWNWNDSGPVPVDPNLISPFGYIGRYDEYRFRRNSVHGKFRTDLKYWTMQRIFSSRPYLNADFIVPNTAERLAFKRVLAVPSEPMFMITFGNRLHVTRPMMWMAMPGRLDHN